MNLSTKEKIFTLLILTALSLIIFGNGLGGKFVYDDSWVILRNPTLDKFLSIPGQFLSSYHYLQPETGLYRPLTLISYSMNFTLASKPFIFHLTNVLLHALASWLVLLLILEIFKSKNLAYLTAMFFLFLPIHTETVTFISGRSDLLAFVFSLLAIWFVVKRKYALGSAIWLLALLAKESAIGTALVIVFYLWAFERLKLGQLVKKILYFVPAGLVYIILRFIALKNNFLANDASYIYNPLKFTDFWTRILTALKIMMIYLSKALVPTNLSADYSFNQIPLVHSLWHPAALAGLAIILALIFLSFWPKTRSTPWSLGAIIFLASYFVISNFFFPIGTIMAERTFYFPSLGLILILAFGLDNLLRWRFKKVWLSLVLIGLFVYGVAIVNRNKVWADEKTLYLDMVAKSPQSAHAKTNLGIYYAKNDEWDKTKIFLEEAYKIAPDHPPLLDALGIVAEHEKKYSQAEQFYLKAISVRPHYATALSNLGRMYFELGQYENSADIYWREFTFQQKPAYILVYAMSKSKLGKYDDAIGAIKKYYGENPNDLKLKFALGYAYYKKGDKATADRYFKESKNPNISDEDFVKGIEKF